MLTTKQANELNKIFKLGQYGSSDNHQKKVSLAKEEKQNSDNKIKKS